MPHIITSRLAGSKRKLPFIDTEELVPRPGDVHLELSSDQPLLPVRKRNIGEWAHTYLRGEPIFLETVVLKGPFVNDPYTPRDTSGRSGADTVPNSQEELEQQEHVPITHKNDTTVSAKTDACSDSLAGPQTSQDVVRSIEGSEIDITKPVVYVQGQPVFPHPVINNNGVQNMLARNVQTWPHQLRAENQIERWEGTRRPYIQNTPWHRQKDIPPFDPAKALAARASLPQQTQKSVSIAPQQRPDCTSVASNQDLRVESTPALSDENVVSAEDTEPTAPVRQIIAVDSQFLVVAEQPDMQTYLESCQTAELLDESQMGPSNVHTRLQQVLGSSPELLTDIDEHARPGFQVEKKADVVFSLAATSPSQERIPCRYPTQSGLRNNDIDPLPLLAANETEPLIKLKQLEDAIDHQLSTTTDQTQHLDSIILVSSSFDGTSHKPVAQQASSEKPGELACSASTDRIESSQPEERNAVASSDNLQPVPDSVSSSRTERTHKGVSFEQSSIRAAFQVNKSFGSNSRSPEKKITVSPNRREAHDATSMRPHVAPTDSITKSPGTKSQQQTSLRVSRKGTLTYGKRKSQASLFSSSRNASLLQTIPRSQRELQRAVVETHGYNYDVGDDFNLDETIDELGSFLSSWDREIGT